MNGVHYVIDKLGQALAQAEREIEQLRSELHNVREHNAAQAEAENPAPPQE